MAWHENGSSGPYYYRSIRQGDRVIRTYIGRGQQAEQMAREVDQRRQQRQAQHQALVQEQARVAKADNLVRELHKLVKLLVQATLVDGGYHQHRGQWRRRRYYAAGSHGS